MRFNLIIQSFVTAVTLSAPALAQTPAPVAIPAPVPGETVIVALSSGDAIRAKLLSETAEAVVLEHPVLGKITVQRTSIASLAVAKAAAPASAPGKAGDSDIAALQAGPAANANMDAPEPMDGIDPGKIVAEKGVPAVPEPPSPWKLLFDANVNYVSAKDKQLDFRFVAGAIYEIKDVEKWKTDAEYFLRTVSQDGTTDNNLLVTSTYDRYFESNPRWLWFIKGQGQWAPLESFDKRISAWGGIGYEFYKAPPLKLLGKLGVGSSYEFGTINEFYPQLYAEIEWDWKITETQSLVGSFWIAPSFEDFTNYLFLARTEWVMKLPEIKGLSLVGGVRWQYQSVVSPADAIQNDIRVYAGVRFEM